MTHGADGDGDANPAAGAAGSGEEQRSSGSRTQSGDGTRTGRDEKRELAIDLLAHIGDDELGLPEAIDRIETVTTDPALTREILDEAELRGIVDREGGRIRIRRGGTFVRFESQVVAREGEFDCRRCGAAISTGHFVRFDSGELGPFGPSCVRKVTGRE